MSRDWLVNGNNITVTGNVDARRAGTVNIFSSQDFFMHTFMERLQARGIRCIPAAEAEVSYLFGEFRQDSLSVRMASYETSVQDVVLMGRSPHKRAMERDNAQDYAIVAQALETVGMADMAKRSFSTLSGGEQQRVILARALAQQTPCLILDEPTNHLDITYQLELMDIVQGLGRTVVAAIHDLNIAAMYCTRLFVMEKGQLVASGTPEEVLTPELIRQVYGVKAKVFRDEAGILRIQYYPEGRKEI